MLVLTIQLEWIQLYVYLFHIVIINELTSV